MTRLSCVTALAALLGCSSPRLSISTGANDFGALAVSAASPEVTFTVTNSGSGQAGAPQVSLTGADAADFVIAGKSCAVALPAGASCTIGVHFAPATTGGKSASLQVTAEPGGSAAAALTGKGLQHVSLKTLALAGGSGNVTDDAGGATCAGACDRGYDAASQVTFTAHPDAGSVFDWTGDCTGSGATCGPVSMSAARHVTARFRKPLNLMFATSQALQIPFAATAAAAQTAADAFCMSNAAAGELPGTYRAWLSTSTQNALDKLGGSDGWVRRDGQPFTDRATLAAGAFYFPGDLDEAGRLPVAGSPLAATGTFIDGSTDGRGSCTDWTSTSGTFVAGDPSEAYWSAYFVQPCSGKYRLLCFETGHSAASVRPSATGRIAFASTGTLTPGGGRAAADQLCQGEAQSAGLTGQFLALVSTTDAAAASRFGPGAPFVRVDGVQLAASPADLDKPNLPSLLDVSATGEHLTGQNLAWSGSSLPGEAGSAATTCLDWTSTAGTGTFGDIYLSSVWFGQFAQETCASNARVFCLQH